MITSSNDCYLTNKSFYLTPDCTFAFFAKICYNNIIKARIKVSFEDDRRMKEILEWGRGLSVNQHAYYIAIKFKLDSSLVFLPQNCTSLVPNLGRSLIIIHLLLLLLLLLARALLYLISQCWNATPNVVYMQWCVLQIYIQFFLCWSVYLYITPHQKIYQLMEPFANKTLWALMQLCIRVTFVCKFYAKYVWS